jgi:hypothetical protein
VQRDHAKADQVAAGSGGETEVDPVSETEGVAG